MAAAAVLVAGLAGCGSVGDRQAAASAAAVRLLTAVQQHDGSAACVLLAPKTAAELTESADKSCPEAILDENLPAPGEVTGAQVYGQWAQVRLTGDTVFLAVFGGGWRVVAAGCTPRGDQPYDCTLQGG
ncbi:hypothetical protein [Actinoplanes sp. NPDC051411]|uniref:hypothetical protein n=1 Tax=Actinoplanes sp. NPDC051411 TaxID=3155522 RepID=UPI003427B7A0